MNVRRSAAALAASAVLCAGAAPPALAAPSPSPAPVIPSGLFGQADPTYDGVWRQSFALLAQHTVGLRPAPQAVDWLTGQQCADGGFASFRADATKACDPAAPLDTNATAVAVQALKALGGHDAAVKKGVDWLRSVQNEDGGWAYVPGSPSEASSTSVVISALAAAGEKPADVKSKAGKSAYDGLLSFRLGCAAEPASDRGAFGYQPADGKLPANADATAAATLAGLGKGAVVTPAATDT
ncbi:prenyltransferase/squalene oxidase repeat-containing protein, partial [Streptomyces sp. NPDC054838]